MKRVNTNCFIKTERNYSKKATTTKDVIYTSSTSSTSGEQGFLPQFASELRKWLHVLPVPFVEASLTTDSSSSSLEAFHLS